MGRRKQGEVEVSEEAKNRQIRIFLTPVQDAQLTDIRKQWGVTEAETVRRAIDAYLQELQTKELYIPSPGATPSAIAAKRIREIEEAEKRALNDVGEDK